MPDIATINGIDENNIATYNGATASTVTGVLGNTWVHAYNVDYLVIAGGGACYHYGSVGGGGGREDENPPLA